MKGAQAAHPFIGLLLLMDNWLRAQARRSRHADSGSRCGMVRNNGSTSSMWCGSSRDEFSPRRTVQNARCDDADGGSFARAFPGLRRSSCLRSHDSLMIACGMSPPFRLYFRS
jgi:hypothetical protein